MENSSSEESSLFSQADRKPVLEKTRLLLPSTDRRFRKKSIEKQDMWCDSSPVHFSQQLSTWEINFVILNTLQVTTQTVCKYQERNSSNRFLWVSTLWIDAILAEDWRWVPGMWMWSLLLYLIQRQLVVTPGGSPWAAAWGWSQVQPDQSWPGKLAGEKQRVTHAMEASVNSDIFWFKSVYLDGNTAEKSCDFIWKLITEELNGDYGGFFLVSPSPPFLRRLLTWTGF